MGGGLSMTLAEVDSPAEGLLSCLWSVLSVALCGASFLMACGPLPLSLVCTSSPCGQGFVVRFGLGAGESLVIGNYSSANMKSQLCHAHSPQGSAGLLHSRLATGEGSGGDVPGWGAAGIGLSEPRGRTGCCPPCLQQGSRGCCLCSKRG